MNTNKRDPKQATHDLISRHELELKWLREDYDFADGNNVHAQPRIMKEIDSKIRTIERLRRFQKMMGWAITDGTPKTLLQAIENGLKAGDEADCKVIEMHVRDFLAQKFGVALLRAGDRDESYCFEMIIEELYETITGRKVK